MWNKGLGRLGYLFYLSKYYEFVDTMILVVKQKKVSVLQSYHHAGAVRPPPPTPLARMARLDGGGSPAACERRDAQTRGAHTPDAPTCPRVLS